MKGLFNVDLGYSSPIFTPKEHVTESYGQHKRNKIKRKNKLKSKGRRK